LRQDKPFEAANAATASDILRIAPAHRDTQPARSNGSKRHFAQNPD